MGQNDDDWDDSNDDDSQPTQQNTNSGKGLRSHAKTLERENSDLKAKLAALEEVSRRERVSKAVEAKGFPKDVVDLIPATVSQDDATLEKWLSEKEALFARNSPPKEETVSQGFPEDEEIEAFERLSRVQSAAIPAGREADLKARIHAAKNRAELDAILREQGNRNVG